VFGEVGASEEGEAVGEVLTLLPSGEGLQATKEARNIGKVKVTVTVE